MYTIRLDLKDAFYQVKISPAGKHITTFKHHDTFYWFNRRPMGLRQSPAIL